MRGSRSRTNRGRRVPRIWKRVNGEEMKGDREMGQEVKQEAGDEEEK